MENKDFVIVLSNNKPQVVICDYKTFENNQKKIREYELELAKQAISTYQKEKNTKKLKKLTSLSDLMP